ncbi:MAG: queuosine salvage family protein [Myxococcota bacterium]
MTLFGTIRERSAEVSRRAESVLIDVDRAGELAREIAAAEPPDDDLDPGATRLGDAETTLAFVVTLDAINFGSGWFPHLQKRGSLSGYLSVATGLRERFEDRGAYSAAELSNFRVSECAEVLGQQEVLADPAVLELMTLYTRALRDLGRWLQERFDGSFARCLEHADGCAESLVECLLEMPFYRDVGRYAGLDIPFYKRAQITASDLHRAFAGESFGHFEDIDELTLFADNLVPHVLRRAGVLHYTPELLARINAGEDLEAGCPEEVEIRASAVHAVELMAEALGSTGMRPRELDGHLWRRGQSPEMKAEPRHRTRCAFY